MHKDLGSDSVNLLGVKISDSIGGLSPADKRDDVSSVLRLDLCRQSFLQ